MAVFTYEVNPSSSPNVLRGFQLGYPPTISYQFIPEEAENQVSSPSSSHQIFLIYFHLYIYTDGCMHRYTTSICIVLVDFICKSQITIQPKTAMNISSISKIPKVPKLLRPLLSIFRVRTVQDRTFKQTKINFCCVQHRQHRHGVMGNKCILVFMLHVVLYYKRTDVWWERGSRSGYCSFRGWLAVCCRCLSE